MPLKFEWYFLFYKYIIKITIYEIKGMYIKDNFQKQKVI